MCVVVVHHGAVATIVGQGNKKYPSTPLEVSFYTKTPLEVSFSTKSVIVGGQNRNV